MYDHINSDKLPAGAVEVAMDRTLEAMDEASDRGWWKGEKIGGEAHARRIVAAFLEALLENDAAMERGRVGMWMTAMDADDFRAALIDAVQDA